MDPRRGHLWSHSFWIFCYFEQFSKGPRKCFERDGNLEAHPEMMVLRRPNARPQRQCAFRLHESAVSGIGSPD